MKAKCIQVLILMVLLSPLGLTEMVSLKATSAYSQLDQNYGGRYLILSELNFLGWAQRKYFAYIVHWPNEARDVEEASLIVQNVINDKIVYKKSWEFTGDFEKSINRMQNIINEILRHYAIKKSGIKLYDFPLYHKGYKYTVTIKSKYKYDTSTSADFVSYSLMKIRKYKGNYFKTKVVHRQLYKSKYNKILNDYMHSNILEEVIMGYFQSPFQDRIAILAAKIGRGWEGPPHTVSLYFVGASLSKRF